jgi:hypothetical protein
MHTCGGYQLGLDTRPRDLTLPLTGLNMLSLREAALCLGFTPRHIQRLVNASQIPVFVTARGHLVRAVDVRKLLIAREKATANA